MPMCVRVDTTPQVRFGLLVMACPCPCVCSETQRLKSVWLSGTGYGWLFKLGRQGCRSGCVWYYIHLTICPLALLLDIRVLCAWRSQALSQTDCFCINIRGSASWAHCLAPCAAACMLSHMARYASTAVFNTEQVSTIGTNQRA